ncbi:MAG: SAM-dependent methyltransferase [Deltaproteobacteria bacterium]|nr:SAM-dependent methyltransferase [Deltaproteobacteria bacterium]
MKLWASQTAEAVCFFRALEHRRPEGERALEDGYAHLFLGPAMRASLEAWTRGGRLGGLAESATFGLGPFIVARHRFIDEVLERTLADGGLDRLVLLGTGYDTRPFRFAEALQRGGVEVVEIDHPATGKRRRAVLERHRERFPEIERRVLAVDFEHEDLGERLAAEGLTDAARTFWVWEGVSMYLTRAAVQRTLSTLHDACGAGSHLCLDLWFLVDDPGFSGTVLRTIPGALSFIGEPITFGLHPEDAPVFLEQEGWAVAELADADGLSARYLGGERPSYRACYVVHAKG